MNTLVGWVIRFLGPGLLKSVLDTVPKDTGTLLTTFIIIAGVVINLLRQAIAGEQVSEAEFTASSAAIGFAVQQYYQRRATANVEKKVEKVSAKVEGVQEGVTEAAEVAAVVTERAEAAVEKAEAAVEAVQGPTPIKRKPGGSGKF